MEKYAMKFVEDTGSNWTAVQLKAVEMEIEQQKREWEEKRLIQSQQEQLEKQRSELEENETLTYSRQDSLNKVNIRTKKNSPLINKRKLESVKDSERVNEKGKTSNGTESGIQNGMSKDMDSKGKLVAKASMSVEASARRHTRNVANRSTYEDSFSVKTRAQITTPTGGRVASRKSGRSVSVNSMKSQARSASESTSRSIADSTSQPTSTMTATPDESDSECSLDVMIDSNDVNDSDSNSNLNTGNTKERSRFDSTSPDEETLQNDESTLRDETTVEKMTKSLTGVDEEGKITSSPRTRSRGTVKINLWTLDESPIMAPKRQKTMNCKSSSYVHSKEEKQLKADFGVKECKVAVVDIHLKPPVNSMLKPSPKPRSQKRHPSAKNNHSLESWVQKPPDVFLNRPCDFSAVNEDAPERIPVTRQRRNTILINNSL